MNSLKPSWPIGSTQPLMVKNSYSWKEVGTIFRLIDEYSVGLVVETGVHNGDFASWMMAKCLFENDFHYTGIALEIECVQPIVRKILEDIPQAFIVPGLSYSEAILHKMEKYIENSYRPVLVFCNGSNTAKEFDAYMKILRPGDVIVVAGFPAQFSLGLFKSNVDNEKLKRVGGDFMLGTRLIGGLVL